MILTRISIYPRDLVGVISVIIVTDNGETNPITKPNNTLMNINNLKFRIINEIIPKKPVKIAENVNTFFLPI